MIKSIISIERLSRLVVRLLIKMGVKPADARKIAWVYRIMTLRGVGHHDINSLPFELTRLEKGYSKPRPRIKLAKDRRAVAVLDGDNGPGPLVAYIMTQKAVAKARKFGLGLVSARNSNHFIGAAAYCLLAAEHGMLGIAASNTDTVMGAHGSADRAIGNNPWGFAVRTGAGFPLLLDICNAYASYGKLHDYRKKGWKVPKEWGLDSRGRNTTDPGRILDGGVPLPMVGHKGFGLSILMEILTSVLSGGAITDEIALMSRQDNGFSHAALVINPAFFMSPRVFKARTRKLVTYLKGHPPLKKGVPILLPGERSYKTGRKLKKTGIRLEPHTRKNLQQWMDKLGVHNI